MEILSPYFASASRLASTLIRGWATWLRHFGLSRFLFDSWSANPTLPKIWSSQTFMDTLTRRLVQGRGLAYVQSVESVGYPSDL